MTIEEIESIEREFEVAFVFKPQTGRIACKGTTDHHVAQALERIAPHREQVNALLRKRQGIADAVVEREIGGSGVPTLAVYRENYRPWCEAHGAYYIKTEQELDKMFAACEEGDEIIFDFARSFTIRKRSGLLVSVDCRGRVGAPSQYSPAIAASKSEKTES
jgi:hypothetical protein